MPLEVADLVPQDKYDLGRAEAAVAAGYPAVAPVLPLLLEWIQDMNWPVARVLGPFLGSIGAPIADAVRPILNGSDDIWKYWVIGQVLAKSPDLRRIFRPSLERLAASPTDNERAEELDELARAVLDA